MTDAWLVDSHCHVDTQVMSESQRRACSTFTCCLSVRCRFDGAARPADTESVLFTG